MYSGANEYTVNEIGTIELSLDTEAARCFRVYRTILEIMEYRQYFVNDESKKMDFLEFKDKFDNLELVDKR